VSSSSSSDVDLRDRQRVTMCGIELGWKLAWRKGS
jgi:hypothetical protein